MRPRHNTNKLAAKSNPSSGKYTSKSKKKADTKVRTAASNDKNSSKLATLAQSRRIKLNESEYSADKTLEKSLNVFLSQKFFKINKSSTFFIFVVRVLCS